MTVSTIKDSPNCDCGTAWILKNDRYECPNCHSFRDKNIILAIVTSDESENNKN